MTRPRLLDLFCGAGGAAVGYHRAGFEVVGVDIKPQPDFPFEFHQANALEFPLEGFDVIHASPPCQRYSNMTKRHQGARKRHPDLVAAVRRRFREEGPLYVIENVPGSPLINPLTLCGSMFGLEVRRHRLFESNLDLRAPGPCNHAAQKRVVGVYGNAGGSSKRSGKKLPMVAEWREAMQIPWMKVSGLRQAIPPAYTRWLGQRIIEEVYL